MEGIIKLIMYFYIFANNKCVSGREYAEIVPNIFTIKDTDGKISNYNKTFCNAMDFNSSCNYYRDYIEIFRDYLFINYLNQAVIYTCENDYGKKIFFHSIYSKSTTLLPAKRQSSIFPIIL